MMVETVLESPQDLGAGMAASGVPQWKRELLQRRAARCVQVSRPPPAPPAPPIPPTPPPLILGTEDEELRYGPGIVQRLKSRYLSLALREAPRRRPSVLRRATSLEHLLGAGDEEVRPRATITVTPRPTPPPTPIRRDTMQRAQSVDALLRLDEERAHSRQPRPPRRPPPLLGQAERPPPDLVRTALRKFEPRPTRRAAPAARVSAVLRGLGARTPPRTSNTAATQTTPSLRTSTRPALPPRPPPRSSTPEPTTRTPSPAASELSAIITRDRSGDASPPSTPPPPVPRRSFDAGERGVPNSCSIAAANPIILGRARTRQVGIIRPMPSPSGAENCAHDSEEEDEDGEKCDSEKLHVEVTVPRVVIFDIGGEMMDRKLEPEEVVESFRDTPERECDRISEDELPEEIPVAIVSEDVQETVIFNGDSSPLVKITDLQIKVNEALATSEVLSGKESPSCVDGKEPPTKLKASVVVTNGEADAIKHEASAKSRANQTIYTNSETVVKSGEVQMKSDEIRFKNGEINLKNSEINVKGGEIRVKSSEIRVKSGDARLTNGLINNGVLNNSVKESPKLESPVVKKPRWHQQEQNTMVFNFSNRKDVPDYIENDGLIMRTSKKDKLKPGDQGVVLLPRRPGAAPPPPPPSDSDDDDDEWLERPPSPCDVRFVNDNVLANGRSSLAVAARKMDRVSKLKLQFDDSLTRTFEYPSEASLCEDSSPSPPDGVSPTPQTTQNTINSNTHIASVSLSSYKPSKMQLQTDVFQLGVTRTHTHNGQRQVNGETKNGDDVNINKELEGIDEIDFLKPCSDDSVLNWSQETNQGASDLLF